jgi:imidazolonepropionase-like amidohydrolase
MSGPPREDCAVVIKGGKIVEVSRKPALAPFPPPRIINARGKTITPGLIDVDSALGMDSGRGGRSTARAEDSFDRYATGVLREALQNGVTAVHVAPQGSSGVRGTGAVIRLEPQQDGSIGEVLKDGADLIVDMGSGQPPVARIQVFDSLRGQFRAALDYRQAREDYEEDLEEYLKKLEERAAKKGGKGKKKDAGSARKRSSGTAREPPKKGEAGKPPDQKKAAEKKDELKKPAEPRRQRHLDVLLRALDRDLRVRVEAHRSEDILNALDIAAEFSLDFVLVGATDAHLVAGEIAGSGAGVVFGSMLYSELRRDDAYRRRLASNGAVLNRAGVPWWVGSGAGSGAEARFVLLNAQIAAARNNGDGALAQVTSRAAQLLDVDGEIGRLRRNLRADLVIWSGDPLDPASRVEQVFVGGKLAYAAEGER